MLAKRNLMKYCRGQSMSLTYRVHGNFHSCTKLAPGLPTRTLNCLGCYCSLFLELFLLVCHLQFFFLKLIVASGGRKFVEAFWFGFGGGVQGGDWLVCLFFKFLRERCSFYSGSAMSGMDAGGFHLSHAQTKPCGPPFSQG